MAEHTAVVTLCAPIDHVYRMFGRFADYPRFLTHVKSVLALDAELTRWTCDIAGVQEWIAVRDGWVENQQVGWRAVDGPSHAATIKLADLGTEQTRVYFALIYEPPAGVLGEIGEILGSGKRLENSIRQDLSRLSELLTLAPVGAADPDSPNYVFGPGSAAVSVNAASNVHEVVGEP